MVPYLLTALHLNYKFFIHVNLLFSTSVELDTRNCPDGCMDVCMSDFFGKSFYGFLSIWYGVLPCPLGHVSCQKEFDQSHPLCPNTFFGVFWSDFSRNFGPIWDFPVWIFMFLASLGLSLGVIFFCLAQFRFLGPGEEGSKWWSARSRPNCTDKMYQNCNSLVCNLKFSMVRWACYYL